MLWMISMQSGGWVRSLDIVALSTPQLDIPEMVQIAEIFEGRQVHGNTTLLLYTPLGAKRGLCTHWRCGNHRERGWACGPWA